MGNNALEICRFYRSVEGTTGARYYWPDPNTVVILHDVENARDGIPDVPNADGARIHFNMADIADRTAFEVWSGAGGGTETNRLAGR